MEYESLVKMIRENFLVKKECRNTSLSPRELEAMGLLEALMWLEELGIYRVIIEHYKVVIYDINENLNDVTQLQFESILQCSTITLNLYD